MSDIGAGRIGRVHVVGTGLIGTSIGLALTRAGIDVTLEDHAPQNASLAASLGAGRVLTEGLQDADIVVIATPPAFVAAGLIAGQRLNLDATFIDVASVKGQVVHEAETTGADMTRFVGSHPIAGRERGGPLNAR
ncbi:MAG: tyrA, partial [Frankiales bacterium]|nr:tyrA [Frankiales bacterium]